MWRRGTSGGEGSQSESYRSTRAARAAGSTSRKPSVVTSAVRAPVRWMMAFVAMVQRALLAKAAAALDLALQDAHQISVVPGLLNEALRAGAHGFDGELDVSPGGHDHDWQRRVDRTRLPQQLQPFISRGGVARVVEIHQQQIPRAIAEVIERRDG